MATVDRQRRSTDKLSLVTGWRQSIVREGVLRCFGHWFDTVDRQRRSIETFCHWLDTSDRQRAGTETLGHLFDTIDRQ